MFDAKSLARPCILRGRPYVPGKPIEEVAREMGLTDIIKVSSNENPWGPSPAAVEAMVDELRSRTYRYPESTAPSLRQALAQRLGVTPEQVILDNGEDAVISLVGMAFLNPSDEVVVPDLSFGSGQATALRMDASPVVVPVAGDLSIDIDATIAAITPKTKLVFLCNPNNPTGLITLQADFERLLAAMPETALLVSDEAYLDFCADPDYPDSLGVLPEHPNLLVLRTFSKAYGLAGVRIGYAIGREEIIALMARVRNVFAVNRIAQAGALAALDDTEFRDHVVNENALGRAAYAAAFQRLGLRFWPSQTNFVLVDVGRPAMEVYENMLGQGVIVRPQQGDRLATCVRISIGTPDENQRAIRALEQALVQ